MLAPGREETKVPRTFNLYPKQPLKRITSNLHPCVQTSGLPNPPSGDFNCKVTKSPAKSPSQDVRGERKNREVSGPSRPLDSSYQLSATRDMEGGGGGWLFGRGHPGGQTGRAAGGAGRS